MSRRASQITVSVRDAGERADVILGRNLSGLSRRAARRLALEGRLRIDGVRAPPSLRPPEGAVLELLLEVMDDEPVVPLHVLHTTEHMVYVGKPSGTHTIAQTPDQPGCLSVAVRDAFPECGEASPDPLEAGAVHRLDQDTSGVVAFARDRDTWLRAREGFRAGVIHKLYLAAVFHEPDTSWPPCPPEGALPGWLRPCPPLRRRPLYPVREDEDREPFEVRAPLGRGSTRDRVAVRLDGRSSCTRIERLASETSPPGDERGGLRASLLLVELVTGSRHQIRAHLAWLGLPICADRLYGDPAQDPGQRLRLHAVSLDLSATVPGEVEVLSAPDQGFWPPGV